MLINYTFLNKALSFIDNGYICRKNPEGIFYKPESKKSGIKFINSENYTLTFCIK